MTLEEEQDHSGNPVVKFMIVVALLGVLAFCFPALSSYYNSYEANQVRVSGSFQGIQQSCGGLEGTCYIVQISGQDYTCVPGNFMSNQDLIALSTAKPGDLVTMTGSCGNVVVSS